MLLRFSILTLFLLYQQLVFAQVVINELSAAEQNYLEDRYHEFDDWVEFYNPTDSAVHMGGYFVSDDIANPTAVQLDPAYAGFTTMQPGEYLTFFCDKGTRQMGAYHLNLKLSAKGEILFLYNADTVLVDSVTFPVQHSNMTYGRLTDGGNSWGFFPQPSPAATNQYGFPGFSEMPNINKPGGFYEGSVTVQLKAPKDCELWVTLDGTDPGPTNGTRGLDKLTIDSTTVLRAVAVQDGLLPSPIVTHTYFIDYEPGLPVFSLSTQHLDIITNTDPYANVYDEMPIHVEFYEQDGRHGFSANMGFRLVGKAIRNYPQKSFAFKARPGYGAASIDYPLFAPQKDIASFEDFALRNSGNDNSRTMMRDGFMQTLVVNHTNVDGQAYKPCIVFVNGEYWGIHNLREKISGAYVEQNHPEDGQDIDMFEWGSQPIQGTMDNLNAFNAFVDSADFTDPVLYDSICALIDLENFIDYQIAEIYFGNTDWPMANMKFWRPAAEGGQWRWILFDVDLAYELNKKFCPGHHNTLKYALGVNNCHLDHLTSSLTKSTVLLQKLILNEDFKAQFISRFMDLLNTHLSAETALHTLDSLKSLIEPEMANHVARWGKQKGIKSMTYWYQEMAQLEQFASERPDTLRAFIAEEFGLDEPLAITVDGTEGGYVMLNTVLAPTETDDLFLYFQDVEVMAVPEEGYEFVKWAGTGSTNPERVVPADEETSMATLQPVFEKVR